MSVGATIDTREERSGEFDASSNSKVAEAECGLVLYIAMTQRDG